MMEYYNSIDSKGKVQKKQDQSEMKKKQDEEISESKTTAKKNRKIGDLAEGKKRKKKELDQKKTKKKRSSTARLNGRFYTEKGLNEKHPDLKKQIDLILQIIERHKLKCHQGLEVAEFEVLKNFLID